MSPADPIPQPPEQGGAAEPPAFLAGFHEAHTPYEKLTWLKKEFSSDFNVFCARLRDARPVFETPMGYFVTRYRDVREVLGDSGRFSVARMGRRMAETAGPFYLGFDEGAEYDHDLKESQQVLAFEIMPEGCPLKQFDTNDRHFGLIGGRARKMSEEIVERATSRCLDVVGDLGNLVTTTVMGEYFGVLNPCKEPAVPLRSPEGPQWPGSPDMILRAFQAVSFYIFNPFATTAIKEGAARAALGINGLLEHRIKARKRALEAGIDEPSDVLKELRIVQERDRTVRYKSLHGSYPDTNEWEDDFGRRQDQIAATHDPYTTTDDVWVRRMLGGLFSGSLVATAGLFANCMDRFTDDRFAPADELRKAASANDVDTVKDYIMEAARLGPFPSMLQRVCTEDTTLGPGNTRIAEGSKVILVLGSATRDTHLGNGDMLENPDGFQLGRPECLTNLVFGHGQHYCIGHQHAPEVMAQMAIPILRQRNLRRATKPNGEQNKLDRNDLGFPSRLMLEFD